MAYDKFIVKIYAAAFKIFAPPFWNLFDVVENILRRACDCPKELEKVKA